MRKILVAGNWKMNGSNAMAKELASAVANGFNSSSSVEMAVFPPFPYLNAVAEASAGTALQFGAQDVNENQAGAHTGETSAAMLVDLQCQMVLVGHSERRANYGDSDARVADKFAAALSAGLLPVLCIGESLEEREGGETEAVISRQLDAVLAKTGIDGFAKAVLAYEPVWAIGTGKTASPEQAQEIHAFIRDKLSALDGIIAGQLRILYGGSVKGSNAAELFAQTDIDGGLIGGASLTAEDFLAIYNAVA
ncbi:MAG: triose-phosphate isomerase [Xanthomonadales bacterium]|nr:triose-phosphate isomerase [Xanthomonadales bacterium]